MVVGLEVRQELRQGLDAQVVIDLGQKPLVLGDAFVVRVRKDGHSAGHSQPRGRGGSSGICCSRPPDVKPANAAGAHAPARFAQRLPDLSDKRLN